MLVVAMLAVIACVLLAGYMAARQLQGLRHMLEQHLPNSVTSRAEWRCSALATPHRRRWTVPNAVAESQAVKAIGEIALSYPGWMPMHHLKGRGLHARWLLELCKPSSKPIEIKQLDGFTTLRRLAIGVDLRRKVVTVAAQVHTLVVALTGWGKSNLMATMINQLMPYMEKGLIQFWCIDLKYGLEVSLYHDSDRLFPRQAHTMQESVDLLEALLAEMERRADAIRGRRRSVNLTNETPRIVLFIDEAMELFNKKNGKEAETVTRLMSSILSRSRALGVVVIAFSQNPRVEAIPVLAGFPQRIAMRLNDESEAEMLLGKAAIEHGAAPWLISLKGSGYVWNEDDGTVSYFRSPLVDDNDVMAMGE